MQHPTDTPSPRSGLSRRRIVDAALELLDRDGVSGLSLRRLARELGVAPMTIYGYFGDKRALLDAVLDASAAEIQVQLTPGDGWRQTVRTVVFAAYAGFARHPELARLRAEGPMLRPAQLSITEVAFSALIEAGLPADEAARSIRLLFTYVMGSAAFGLPSDPEPVRAAAWAALRALPPDEFPTMSAHVDEAVAALGGDEQFAYGLDCILDGLERRILELSRERR